MWWIFFLYYYLFPFSFFGLNFRFVCAEVESVQVFCVLYEVVGL